ncbi:MAG: hypothetical protein IJ795_05060 [Bacteroidales bacterium]|nr:hypothetical protein [Bacteroidales bacterium]
MAKKILCCIFNYNVNEGAIAWSERLSAHFDTLILDSGSNPRCVHPTAVPLDNIFYSGLMNEAWKRAHEGGYDWLVVLTSDLEINDRNFARLSRGIEDISRSVNVGLYQPSNSWKGRSHHQSRCWYTGRMRCVNFQEGWFHMVRMDLLDKVCPIDLDLNRLGWGIDLALSHFARVNGLLILVDDRVRVTHPHGSGYNKDEADRQMRAWLATIPGFSSSRHYRAWKAPVKYEE